jgi:hypothetical protein
MLFSFQISFLFLIRIVTIALFYVAALYLSVVYIQLAVSDIGIYGGLFFSSLPLVKPKRLTKDERSNFNLPEDLKNISVGLILGDLNIHKLRVNARLCFKQGIVHKDYIFHLSDLFQNFCSSGPKTCNPAVDGRTGKVYPFLYFKTYTLFCFTELYELFYTASGKKVVPLNIGEVLTPIGLAYWLADDGCFCKSSHRIILCTDSFTLNEVNLLMEVLNNKWNLESYKVSKGSGYRIIVPRRSLSILQGLLKDIMPPMMLYKIGL